MKPIHIEHAMSTVLAYALACDLLHKVEGVYWPSKDWLQQPGTVYVCEGRTARFLWKYNHNLGNFSSLLVYKKPPDEKILIAKNGPMTRIRYSHKADLLPFTYSGFTLYQTSMDDIGKYAIEIDLKEPHKRLHGEAELQVIPAKACPDARHYQFPDIYLNQNCVDNNEIIDNNEEIELVDNSNITLLVVIPAADPPVTCFITSSLTHKLCNGTSDSQSKCEVRLLFDNELYQEVKVTLTYLAFEPATTTFFVRIKGVTISPTLTLMKEGGLSVGEISVIVVVPILLVSTICVLLLWYLWRRRRGLTRSGEGGQLYEMDRLQSDRRGEIDRNHRRVQANGHGEIDRHSRGIRTDRRGRIDRHTGRAHNNIRWEIDLDRRPRRAEQNIYV